jgi:hypothetical protein
MPSLHNFTLKFYLHFLISPKHDAYSAYLILGSIITLLDEECKLWSSFNVIFEVLTAMAMKSSIFWDITPCSPIESQPTFRENMSLCVPPDFTLVSCFVSFFILKMEVTYSFEIYLRPAFMLVFCIAYFSTLKLEAIYFSETSVEFQRTARRCNPRK